MGGGGAGSARRRQRPRHRCAASASGAANERRPSGADVRRRVGVDRERLPALPRLSPGAPAPSASTTASSWSARTCCAAAPARRRRAHPRHLPQFLLSRISAGSSPACASPRTPHDRMRPGARSLGRATRRLNAECSEFADALIAGLSAAEIDPLPLLLRCARQRTVRGASPSSPNIIRRAPRRDPARLRRRHGGAGGAGTRADRVRLRLEPKTELLLARCATSTPMCRSTLRGGAGRGAAAHRGAIPGICGAAGAGRLSRPLTLPPDIAAQPAPRVFSRLDHRQSRPRPRRWAAHQHAAHPRRRRQADHRRRPQEGCAPLIAAYDDAAGVTAAFNLNLLHRANRELGADFDVARFAHLATYDVRPGASTCICVRRPSRECACSGRRFHFAAGERIHTEHSHKYDVEGFQVLAQHAGWLPAKRLDRRGAPVQRPRAFGGLNRRHLPRPGELR